MLINISILEMSEEEEVQNWRQERIKEDQEEEENQDKIKRNW